MSETFGTSAAAQSISIDVPPSTLPDWIKERRFTSQIPRRWLARSSRRKWLGPSRYHNRSRSIRGYASAHRESDRASYPLLSRQQNSSTADRSRSLTCVRLFAASALWAAPASQH